MPIYLLKANEHAAAEKQPAIHVPTVDKAGKARQLRAAPIVYLYVKKRKKKKKRKRKTENQPRGLLNFLFYTMMQFCYM